MTLMKESVYIIHWRGPYTEEQARSISDSSILYFVTGGLATEPVEKARYCGITDVPFRDRQRQHHRLDEITTNKTFWMGWMHYPHPLQPGRSELELIESLVIYYWGELLNMRKAFSPPPTSLTLISRWHSVDWQSLQDKPPLFSELPDVISWDSEQKTWQTANFGKRYSDY